MNTETSKTSNPSAVLLLSVYGPAVLVLILALAGSLVTERPISDFTRDLASIAQVPPFIGLVSNLGILLWASAAATGLVTAAVLAKDQAPQMLTRFFLWFGLLTSLLALDDFFLLHERMFPRFLGLPEEATLVIYGVLLLYILIRFRPVYRTMPCFFLWAALVGFASSLLVDQVPEHIIPYHHLFEDGFKFLGISSWLAFVAQAAVRQLSYRHEPA